jgi:MFS family permease
MLSYAVAAMIVGQSCLFTVLPPIGREVGLTDLQIGLVLSVHGLFMLFTGPIAGALSERWGRRRILVVGTTLYAGSILAFGFIIDSALDGVIAGTAVVIALVLSRAVFAAGAGAVMPGAMALAADLSSRENRLKAMSLLGASTSAGAMIGPSFAALFAGVGPSAPFYFIAGFGIAGAIAARFVLPEPRAVSRRAPLGAAALWLGRPGLIALGNTLYLIGCYGIYSILGFMFQDRFQLSTENAVQAMGLGLMASATTNVVTQALLVRRMTIGPAAMLAIAVPLTAAGFLVIDLASDVSTAIAGMVINAVGQAIAGSAFATALSLSVGAGAQGRVAGLSTAAQAIAFLTGPIGAAAIYQADAGLPFVLGCILVAVALATAFVIRVRREGLAPSSPAGTEGR